MSSKDDDIDVSIDEDEWLEKREDSEKNFVQPTQGMETDDGIVALELDEALKKHHEIQRSNGRSPTTIDTHNRKLPNFLAWLKVVADVETTADIKPRHLRDYRTQLDQDYDNPVTVKSEAGRVRAFIRNLGTVQAVPEGYDEYIPLPSLEGDEGQRSDHLPVARGDRLLGVLRNYEWGSMRHVFYELMWAGGLRLGSIHSLDVGDVDFENGGLRLRHRPESGTTLKNGAGGERFVSLRPETLDAIRDYIDHPHRPEVDDEGRKPLLVTENGRPSKSHLRNICYQMTTPCFSQDGCPYSQEKLQRDAADEDYPTLCGDEMDCRARRNKNKSSKCPGSKAPHALRSGALTRQLKRGIPPTVIGERANVGVETLKKHYDEMSDEEKARARRSWFDDEYELSGEEAEERMFGRTDGYDEGDSGGSTTN